MVDVLDDVSQVFQIVSEQKTHKTDDRGPDYRSREVEEKEASVGHLEKPGQRPCEYPQPGDEAAREYRPVPVFEKKRFGILKPARHELEAQNVAIEKAVASIAAERVAKAVADRRSGNGDPDRPFQSKLPLVSKESREQQNSFAGQRQTAVFQHHAEEYHPVPVLGEEMRQGLEE